MANVSAAAGIEENLIIESRSIIMPFQYVGSEKITGDECIIE
jgi:hypothetical protein